MGLYPDGILLLLFQAQRDAIDQIYVAGTCQSSDEDTSRFFMMIGQKTITRFFISFLHVRFNAVNVI